MTLRHTYILIHLSGAQLTVLDNESALCQSVRVRLSYYKQLLRPKLGSARVYLVSVGNGAVVNEEMIVPVIFPRSLDLLFKMSYDENGKISPYFLRKLYTEGVAFVFAHKVAVLGGKPLNVVLVFK